MPPAKLHPKFPFALNYAFPGMPTKLRRLRPLPVHEGKRSHAQANVGYYYCWGVCLDTSVTCDVLVVTLVAQVQFCVQEIVYLSKENGFLNLIENVAANGAR